MKKNLFLIVCLGFSNFSWATSCASPSYGAGDCSGSKPSGSICCYNPVCRSIGSYWTISGALPPGSNCKTIKTG
jgi:hypothetical protein